MVHLDINEIRRRETNNATYYVIGELVREQLIALTEALRGIIELGQGVPHKWNGNDADALATMDKWLKEDRDFNNNQWTKFGRMLQKFDGIPSSLNALAKEFGWTMGRSLTQQEMFDIMQERRDNIAKAKYIDDGKVKATGVVNQTIFGDLFEVDE